VNQRGGGAWHAFIWQDGILRDLGHLGGGWALAYAVNATGHVVGVSVASDFTYHAFRWHQGRMTDLTEASGGALSWAQDINLAGEIVGYGPSQLDHDSHAVRYDHGKTAILSDEVEDLGDWKLDRAWFINDRGDITGLGSRSDGYHWFMLVRQRGAP